LGFGARLVFEFGWHLSHSLCGRWGSLSFAQMRTHKCIYTVTPTNEPTNQPANQPTNQPTIYSSIHPSNQPSNERTNQPSGHPSTHPPSNQLNKPTQIKSNQIKSTAPQPTNQPNKQHTKPINQTSSPTVYVDNIVRQVLLLVLRVPRTRVFGRHLC